MDVCARRLSKNINDSGILRELRYRDFTASMSRDDVRRREKNFTICFSDATAKGQFLFSPSLSLHLSLNCN